MAGLRKRILEAEQVHAKLSAEFKQSVINVVDSISPSSLLKNALKDIGSSHELRTTVLDTAIGIGAGFLGKKLYVGNSGNVFKKVAGTAVQFLITYFVRKKIPELRENHVYHNDEVKAGN